MPTQNVNLSDQQARFVRKSVIAGGFRNASEVVRAGLRLLEQQQRMEQIKLQTLRKLARQAFDEIEGGDFESIELGGVDRFVEKLAPRSSKSR